MPARYIQLSGFLVFFFVATFSNAAQAQGLCTGVQGLIRQAQANYPEPIAHPVLTGAPDCELSLGLSGARAYHCGWAFGYRAPEAAAMFSEIDRDIQQCLGDPDQRAGDTIVNHPDSYDLRQYLVDGVMVSVSLKDKGALQQTYVFLRINRVTDD